MGLKCYISCTSASPLPSSFVPEKKYDTFSYFTAVNGHSKASYMISL